MISFMSNSKCNPDIICVQETWNIADPDLFCLPGYHRPLFKLRDQKQGGGVAIYVKDIYTFSPIDKYSSHVDKVFESLFVEVRTLCKKRYIIGNIYRTNAKFTSLSERHQFDTFIDFLNNVLADCNESNFSTYIAGDFNINVLNYDHDNLATEYVNNIFLHGFLQIVTKPTRCTNNSATLIDHFLTNDIKSSYDCKIITCKLSDHFPVILSIGKDTKPRDDFIKSRFLTENNILRFKNDLENINWTTVTNCNDPQIAYDLFSEIFIDLYNLHFPVKNVRLNRNIHKYEKWFTRGLLVSRRKKLYLANRAARFPTIENKSLYSNFRNVYNRVVKESKKLYFDNEFEKHKSNLKVTWDLLRKAMRKNRILKSSIQSININGSIIFEPKAIADHFNVFFTTIADTIAEEIHPTVRPPEYPIDHNLPIFNISNNPVTNFEVLTTFHQLNSKKSEDYTGISMYFLKNLVLQLVSPLTHIFNLSFDNGIVPHQLKIAKVVPIFKSGDPMLVDNYRPISLLCNFSKVLEKIMCNRLTKFLNDNKVLSNSQYGFRRKHSTIHPIIHLLNEVTKASTAKKYTLAIFCDLRKAFDTCNHEILIKKLRKIGITNNELNWFVSYLSGRMQFVYLNGTESDKLEIRKGVPQGSILGPLLFLIYVNDLPECSALITLLFADDTTLLASGDNLQDLVTFVNSEFKKVVSYFRAHQMALHPSKTKYVIFNASEQILVNQNIDVFIDCNNDNENSATLKIPIERISIYSTIPAIKFLGVHLDPKLNFKYHLSQILKKISRALYIIQSTKNMLSEKSLKSLYYALVHSHLIYGIHIWSCTSASNLNGLEKIQKKAIRIVNKASYNSHTIPLFISSGILPLKSLSAYFKLLFMYDFNSNALPASFVNTWMSNRSVRNVDNFDNVRPLRNDTLLNVPFVRLEHFLKFPLSDYPRLWNEFNNAVMANSRGLFKELLKGYFIDKLNNMPICNRLLCPACHLQAGL
jgi:hypothetical protein